MNMTVPDVMRRVRNHFVSSRIHGSWQLSDGQLLPEGTFQPGEWIAVPDGPCQGVWQLDEQGAIPSMQDAAWDGDILLLAPPPDFIRLCEKISDWVHKHPDPSTASEHFGEYSRTQRSGSWEQVFSLALAPYTRMYTEVNI